MSVSELPMICVQPYPQTSAEVPEVLEVLLFCRGMKFDCLDVFVFSLIWGFSSGVTVVSKQANNTLPCSLEVGTNCGLFTTTALTPRRTRNIDQQNPKETSWPYCKYLVDFQDL
jgi:hypothetical protein